MKLLILLVASGILASACSSGSEDNEASPTPDVGPGFEAFQTAVANAEDHTVYWLGREFEAGGAAFEGPSTNGTALDDDGFVAATYFHVSGQSALSMSSSSHAAWDREKARVLRPELVLRQARAGPYEVTLLPATMFVRTGIIETDDTVIIVSVHSATFQTPVTSTENPMVDDESVFLEMLAQLRPYPE